MHIVNKAREEEILLDQMIRDLDTGHAVRDKYVDCIKAGSDEITLNTILDRAVERGDLCDEEVHFIKFSIPTSRAKVWWPFEKGDK